MVQNSYTTERLKLNRLNLNDAPFIFELLNTEGWITFIGDRNMKSKEDAQEYIRKTLVDPNIHYWLVQTKKEKLSIGLISFIKRDYLEHYDLGFAFLPAFQHKGFAYEAAHKVLCDRLKDADHKTILATVMPENLNSLKLLQKLGFQRIKKMEHDHKRLLLYGIRKNQILPYTCLGNSKDKQTRKT